MEEYVPIMTYSEMIDFVGDFCRSRKEFLKGLSNHDLILTVNCLCLVMPEWQPLKNFINESAFNAAAVYDFVLGYKTIVIKEGN